MGLYLLIGRSNEQRASNPLSPVEHHQGWLEVAFDIIK
jgi:hypothetical protein